MEAAARAITSGELAVIPSDTIYGVVAQAFNPRAVERLYRLKRRHPAKPSIILIGDARDLAKFGISLEGGRLEALSRWWPGRVSVVLPCLGQELAYLHRGTFSLAFRVPDKPELSRLIAKTGPLVAPSANPEGSPPAATVAEAKAYFGSAAACYVDGGEVQGKPSKVIKIEDGRVRVLRP
ncbi:threonylcarbamoyl-AMP synthase [Candidatus Parcubacteria bacterium]|nr:threonylcarbamoyl-AMP synthase [Candidatus Parcubacteria bacterium]